MSESIVALLITLAVFAFLAAWVPFLDRCDAGYRRLILNRERQKAFRFEPEESNPSLAEPDL